MTETAFTLLTPGNNSGVLGLARATLDGTTLRVDVVASGLTPGETHPFHLHGFLDDRPERLAVAADDADGDGFVETAEGESAAYGPVIAGLTASGDAAFGLESSPDFPAADADGTLRFSQTYALDPSDAADDARILERLDARFEGRVLEFHGLDLPPGPGAGTGGEVDGDGGYDPQVPVAQGPLFAPGFALAPQTVSSLLQGQEAFLDRGAAALSLLAPYTLDPAGDGPVAPEPEGAAAGADAEFFAALLAPSNGSGALGAALVSIDREDASLRVELWMTGLTPGEVHASHIHGFADDSPSLLPNYRLDADADGFVEDAEGAPVVGPVLLGLTTDGSVTAEKLEAPFPEADAEGDLVLRQTYDFDEGDPEQAAIFQDLTDRLTGREVQVHGLFVPGT